MLDNEWILQLTLCKKKKKKKTRLCQAIHKALELAKEKRGLTDEWYEDHSWFHLKFLFISYQAI
jgi:hypothetical protein